MARFSSKAHIADGGDLVRAKGRVLCLEINNQLAHIRRKAARGVRRGCGFLREEAGHPRELELLCFPLQGSWSLAGFFGPFRCALIEEHNRSEHFISCLLRPKCVLPDVLPVMRPFALWALAPGHESYLTQRSWFFYCTLARLSRQAEWAARSECQ